MSYEYIERMYGVRYEIGQRVQSEDGKYHGSVADNRRGEHYAYVRIDGRQHTDPFHPLDLIPEAVATPTEE